jgi:predicted nuclease of predicted toxin-antitoxin system
MRFLIDRCAGHRLAKWLRDEGHDVREATEIAPDPGDQALLSWAVREARILVTIDSDFGLLAFHRNAPHAGIIRLPDLPAKPRIDLMRQLLDRYADELSDGAILTVGTDRVRTSRTPPASS